MNNWTVYKHTLPDGKVYIGITSLSPTERWDDGFGYLKQHSFFKHIVKFGWDNIKHEIVANGVSEQTARLLERELIMDAKDNSVNVQHRVSENVNWTKQPIVNDDVYDRKVKFREMSDIWLNKVQYKGTVPFDWDICDKYIDFRYAIDGENLEMITIRVAIPDNVSYTGLYDYLYWRLDFNDAEVINSLIVDRDKFMECCEQLGIGRATWYNRLKGVC
jgi:hypothetical protein